MTDMAISSYLGWLLLLIGCYPFLLVGVSMFFYDAERKQALRWLNGVSFLLAFPARINFSVFGTMVEVR